MRKQKTAGSQKPAPPPAPIHPDIPDIPSGVKELKFLTLKERIGLASYCSGKTKTQSAKDAGFKDGPGIWEQAHRFFDRLLRKVEVSRAVEHVFARRGATLEAAADAVARGLHAQKPVTVLQKVKDEEGRVREINEKIEYVDDITIQLHAAEVRNEIVSAVTKVTKKTFPPGVDGSTEEVYDLLRWNESNGSADRR